MRFVLCRTRKSVFDGPHPPNPLRPRAFGGLGAEGMKKEIPSNGMAAPDGWLVCDGLSYPSNDPRYASLASVIGTIYGTQGANTFKVPDLRGRTPIGSGQGTGLSNRLIAQATGAEMHVLSLAEMPSHKHNARDTGHSHSWKHERASGGLGNQPAGTTVNDPIPPAFTKTVSGSANIVEDFVGGNQPHNNMQPSLVLNYIIKL